MLDLKPRISASLVACLVTLGAAAEASAQGPNFGRSGDFVIGAERMFGFLSTTSSEDEGNVESSSTITQVSLLASGNAGSPYASPRIALDGFVADSISLGVLLGVATVSIERETSTSGASATVEGPSGLGIVAGARAGYAAMFSDTVGIWPHLGLTYFTASIEDDDDGDETSVNGLALSLDAMLVVTPAPNFGLSIGPVFDLGLTGGSEVTTTIAGTSTSVESDGTITDVGVQAGLFGWF